MTQIPQISRTFRILHCLRAPVGGLFRHVLDLAAEQAALGHDVGLITDANTGDRLTVPRLEALAPHMTLGITRLPISRLPGPGDIAAARATANVARNLNATVLHGHGAKGGAYARIARRALRREGHAVTSFYTPHGGSLNYKPGSMESRVFCGLEQIFDGWTDGLIFESAYAKTKYGQLVGFKNAPSRVIPNGLRPTDFFEPEHGPGTAEFVFLGELRPVKGIDLFLRALANLHPVTPARAVIVGAGPLDAELKALVASLGLAGHVRFTGALPASEAFKLGRCFVVPSLAESFPYVVLEAAAAGLPLISTDVGGIPEIVAGTDTPLIKAGAVEPLADAMRAVLAQPDTARLRAVRLKANVAEKFAVAGMTRSIIEFYEDRAIEHIRVAA
jgi:glycosyltransferase involved in cell wall biosynthesis